MPNANMEIHPVAIRRIVRFNEEELREPIGRTRSTPDKWSRSMKLVSLRVGANICLLKGNF